MDKDYKEISNPKYYSKFGELQPIDVVEHFNLNYHLASAVVYILRYGHKTPPEDLSDIYKAIWYLERFIIFKQKNDKNYE